MREQFDAIIGEFSEMFDNEDNEILNALKKARDLTDDNLDAESTDKIIFAVLDHLGKKLDTQIAEVETLMEACENGDDSAEVMTEIEDLAKRLGISLDGIAADGAELGVPESLEAEIDALGGSSLQYDAEDDDETSDSLDANLISLAADLGISLDALEGLDDDDEDASDDSEITADGSEEMTPDSLLSNLRGLAAKYGFSDGDDSEPVEAVEPETLLHNRDAIMRMLDGLDFEALRKLDSDLDALAEELGISLDNTDDDDGDEIDSAALEDTLNALLDDWD